MAMAFVCLYHRTDRTDVTEEDILQRAFGGKKTSKEIICKECNNKLGSSIDKEHAESLAWVTSLVNPAGRRKPAQPLKSVIDVNGDRWNINPGGKPSVPYESIGENTWRADASQLERVKKNAEAKAKASGIENLIVNVQHHSVQPGAFEFDLLLNNLVTFRSACKASLEALFVLALDDSDKRGDLLADAREFVMSGTFYQPVGWLVSSVRPGVLVNDIDHSILLVQSEDLSVYWEYILYGGVVAVSGRFDSMSYSQMLCSDMIRRPLLF